MRSGSRVVVSIARAMMRSRAGLDAATELSELFESDAELLEHATNEHTRARTAIGPNRDLVLRDEDFCLGEFIMSPRTKYEWHQYATFVTV